jgi:hypothetical protein
MKINREYYPIADAANIAGCTIGDLIHYGATEKIKLYIHQMRAGVLLKRGDNLDEYIDSEPNDLPGYKQFVPDGPMSLLKHDCEYLEAYGKTHARLLCFVDKNGKQRYASPFSETGSADKRIEIYIDDLIIIKDDILKIKSSTFSQLPSAETNKSLWPWGNHETVLLHHLAAAAKKFWTLYDPDDQSTAPTNNEVRDWLIKQGVGKRVAEIMAQILRADGLPKGPRK